MKYALDTNAVSALMTGGLDVITPFRTWHRNDVGVPGPVVAKIQYGIMRLDASKKRQRLHDRFELLRSEIDLIA